MGRKSGKGKSRREDDAWRKRRDLFNEGDHLSRSRRTTSGKSSEVPLYYKILIIISIWGLLLLEAQEVAAKPSMRRSQGKAKASLPPGYGGDSMGIGQSSHASSSSVQRVGPEADYRDVCRQLPFSPGNIPPDMRMDVRPDSLFTVPACALTDPGCPTYVKENFNKFMRETKEKLNGIVLQYRQELINNPWKFQTKLQSLQKQIMESSSNVDEKPDLTPAYLGRYMAGLLNAERAEKIGYGNCEEFAYYAARELHKLPTPPRTIQRVTFAQGRVDHMFIMINSNIKDGKWTNPSEVQKNWQNLSKGDVCDMWNGRLFLPVDEAKRQYNLYSTQRVAWDLLEVVTLI